MWISTRSPWSSFSTFPSFTTSSFTIPLNPPRITRPTRSYQINQDDHAFNLRLDVPGLQIDDLTVEVKDQILQVKLKTLSEAEIDPTSLDPDPQDPSSQLGRWIFNELNSQSKSYKFTLPSTVQSDQIQAKLKNGQLFLTLPKSQPLVQNIKIQQGV